MTDLLLVALGVLLLALGGDLLVRGALAVAQRLGTSPLLSGLLIVGFGTSAPELVVSVDAAIRERPDIAVGNVIGSNIGNVLLILGICALITPLVVKPDVLRRDITSVLLATASFVALAAFDGHVGRFNGALLLTALAAYVTWVYRTERASDKESRQLHEAEATEVNAVPTSIAWTTTATVGGLGLLIIGSKVLLHGAMGVAERFGVSEALIGLTLVAVGTSLPELTVSVIAAVRRHADVAVGNVLGSNLFNLLGVLGVSASLRPLVLADRILLFDEWVMLGSILMLGLFLLTGRIVSRLEGALLLAGYAGYVAVGLIILDG